MRVLFVTPYPVHPLAREADRHARYGGVEVAVERMAAGLASRGHDVTVLATSEEDVLIDDGGVRHLCVRRWGTALGTPLAPRLRDLPGADVVHVLGTYPGLSEVAVAEARRRGTPVVLDYHFDGTVRSPWAAPAPALYYALAGRTLRAADLVLAKTRSYAAASPFLASVPERKLAFVPNGVDADAFPLREGPRDGVVCVGRLVPYKGVETLVRAAAILARRRDVHVAVAGDGPLRGELERLALRLQAPVRFLGRVPGEALPDLYGTAQVAVLPSVNRQEAFGITLLEAMATGTPVVASDLPGVRDVARLGGAVVPPRDPAALADAIEATCDAPPMPPDELSARVAKTYAWDAVVDALEAAYARASGAAG